MNKDVYDERYGYPPGQVFNLTCSGGPILNPSWDIPWIQERQLMPWLHNREECKYCQSKSPSDANGNCAACGAPRS